MSSRISRREYVEQWVWKCHFNQNKLLTDKTEESGAEKSGRSREFNREDMRRDHIEERESHRNPENTEFAYPESPPIQPPASPNENAFKEASEAPAQSVFIHRMEVALAECHNHASPRKLATAYWRIYAGDFDNDFTKAYGGIPISEAVRDTGIEYDREKGSEGTFALRHMKGDAPCSHSTSKRKRKKPLYESDDGEEEANEIVKKRREMDEEAPLPGCNAEDKRNYLREIDSHHPSANNNDGKKPEKTEKSFDGEDEPEKESSSDNNWTQSENALFDYYEDDLELPTTEPDHYRFRGYFKDEIKETLESLPAQWVSWPNLVAAHKESGLYTCNLPMLESASKFYDDACIRTYLAVFIEMRPGKKKEDRLFCLRSRLDEVAEPADPISPLKNTPLPCTPEREEDQEPVPDSPLKPPPTPVPMESPEKERPYGPLLPMPVSVRQPILQPERYSSPEPEGSLGSSSSDSSSSSSCSSCSSSSSSSSSSSWSTYSVERVVTLKETPKSSRSRRSLRNARSRSGSYRSPSGNGNRRKSRSRSRTRLRRDRRSSSRPRRHSRTRRRSRSRQRDQRDVASPTGDSTSSHLTLWGPKFIELKRDSRSPSSTAGKRKDHRWSSSSPSDSPRKRRGSYRRRSRSRDRSSIRTPSIMQERLAKIYKEQEVAATRPPSPNHAKKRKEGSKAAEKSDDGEDFTNKIPKKAEKVEKQLPSVQKPAAGPLKLQQKIKIKLSCEANPESCDFLETPRASDATKKDKVSATQRFATKLAKLKARVMKK